MVLADGSAIWADETNYQDLFRAIPLSYGTLGFLVSVNIRILPYKPYVKHTYYPVHSLGKMVELEMEEQQR